MVRTKGQKLFESIAIIVGIIFIALLANVTPVAQQGVSAKSLQAAVQQVPQLGTYPLPAWWVDNTGKKVDCDKYNYVQKVPRVDPATIKPLATWRGIEACGPRPFTVSTPDNYVTFPGGSVEQEFECTELVKRYIYLAYGLNALSGTYGFQVVDKYTSTYATTFHKVVNDGKLRMVPAEGDVLSFGTVTPGHTSIVTSSSIDGNGNGTITVIEQNLSASGTESLAVSNWKITGTSSNLAVASWMTTRPLTNQSTINFSVTMPSIGLGQYDNHTPRYPVRTATIRLLNASNQLVNTYQTTVTYSQGVYRGSVNLGSLTAGGAYQATVRLNNTLYALLPGFFVAPAAWNPATKALVSGDINQDNKIDVADYNALLSCYGSKFSTCAFNPGADLNDDGVVDGTDYNLWLKQSQTQTGR